MSIVTSDSIAELSKALVKAQAELANPKRMAKNDFLNYKYAKLEEVINVSKIPLANNGLVIIQAPSQEDNWVHVTTRLQHESGEYMESTLSMPLPPQSKNMAQEIGKCITYGRRYSLASICGIEQEDSDAQGSSQSKPQSLPVKKKQTLTMQDAEAQAKKQDLINNYIHKIDANCAQEEAGEVKALLHEVIDAGIRSEVWGGVNQVTKDFIDVMGAKQVA